VAWGNAEHLHFACLNAHVSGEPICQPVVRAIGRGNVNGRAPDIIPVVCLSVTSALTPADLGDHPAKVDSLAWKSTTGGINPAWWNLSARCIVEPARERSTRHRIRSPAGFSGGALSCLFVE